jgi:integrase
MPKVKLTGAMLDRLKLPTKGQVDYFDSAYPALALRLTPAGVRSWVYFGRVHGKLKRATLGRYPGMSLAEARRAASAMADSMRAGINPTAAKREARAAADRDSFEALCEEWLNRDQGQNRSIAHVRAIMNRYPIPAWNGRPISSITRRDVIELIDAVADRGFATMAHRLHAHLHRFFKWSAGRGVIPINPMADLPRQGAVAKRDRVLIDRELALVWRAAGDIAWPFGPLFRLLLLSGARREEMGGLRWAEIEEATIRLEGVRTKNGAPHTIPLSRQAAALIETLPRVEHSPLVFTTTGETSVSGWSKAKATLDTAVTALNGGTPLPPWRTHDLRRTLATGLQRLGVALPVVEAVLGHIAGSRAGVVGIYQRHGYEAEKCQALDAWGRHVDQLVGNKPAQIMALRRTG